MFDQVADPFSFWGSAQRVFEKASEIQSDCERFSMNPEPVSTGATGGAGRFEAGVVGALLLACGVALSPNVADADLWGHVWYGRDALRDGLPATTTYSFTAEGYPWINHENLFEVAAALGADTIGPVGLLVVKALLGVGIISWMLWRARAAGVGLLAAGSLALLISVNLTYHWSIRPQLFTYVSYAVLLGLLSWSFAGWEGQWWLPWLRRAAPDAGREATASVAGPEHLTVRVHRLWLVPVLFVFWTNSHGGFVAGLAIYIAYLGCRAIEALASRGRAALGLVGQLAAMAAVGGLSTFVNPYGWRLHSWLLFDLTLPRPEITEWHPPQFTNPLSIPLWLNLAAFAITVLFSRRARDFTHLTILGLTLWQSLCHQRHIPFFAIAFGFWMMPHLDSVLKRLTSGSMAGAGRTASGRPHWGFVAALGCAYLLLGFKLYGRWHDLPVQRSQYPVSAFQFMADHNLQGRLVVTYNWAQYAIAAFGSVDSREPQLRVSYDGRHRTCYPLEIGDLHFDLILGNGGPNFRYRCPESPPFDPTRILEIGDPNLVLINRFQPHSVRVMEQQSSWVLLYQDQVAQLWGRAVEFDHPSGQQYLAPDQRIIGDEPQVGSVTWPALPVRRSQRPVQLAESRE